MNRPTKHIFSRGMAILLFVVFVTALVTYSIPAQAKVKDRDDVSVAGDLDDVSGNRISSGGGAAVVGGSGGYNIVSANRSVSSKAGRVNISMFDVFATEFIGIWMFMMRR